MEDPLEDCWVSNDPPMLPEGKRLSIPKFWSKIRQAVWPSIRITQTDTQTHKSSFIYKIAFSCIWMRNFRTEFANKILKKIVFVVNKTVFKPEASSDWFQADGEVSLCDFLLMY